MRERVGVPTKTRRKTCKEDLAKWKDVDSWSNRRKEV